MLTLPPVKGEISLAGVLPFAGVGGSARTRVIVVVVVVVWSECVSGERAAILSAA